MNAKWEPIESAPKDGSYVLVYPGHGSRFSIARFNYDRFSCKPRPYWDRLGALTSESRRRPPTHWMPLPRAPGEIA